MRPYCNVKKRTHRLDEVPMSNTPPRRAIAYPLSYYTTINDNRKVHHGDFCHKIQHNRIEAPIFAQSLDLYGKINERANFPTIPR